MRIMLCMALVWFLYTFDYWGRIQVMEFEDLHHCQKTMQKLNSAGMTTSVCVRGQK